MAIYRLLTQNVSSFVADDIRHMSTAYEATLKLLHKERTDPVNEVIALKIIEVTRAGEHDPPHICARAIKELGIPVPD